MFIDKKYVNQASIILSTNFVIPIKRKVANRKSREI